MDWRLAVDGAQRDHLRNAIAEALRKVGMAQSAPGAAQPPDLAAKARVAAERFEAKVFEEASSREDFLNRVGIKLQQFEVKEKELLAQQQLQIQQQQQAAVVQQQQAAVQLHHQQQLAQAHAAAQPALDLAQRLDALRRRWLPHVREWAAKVRRMLVEGHDVAADQRQQLERLLQFIQTRILAVLETTTLPAGLDLEKLNMLEQNIQKLGQRKMFGGSGPHPTQPQPSPGQLQQQQQQQQQVHFQQQQQQQLQQQQIQLQQQQQSRLEMAQTKAKSEFAANLEAERRRKEQADARLREQHQERVRDAQQQQQRAAAPARAAAAQAQAAQQSQRALPAQQALRGIPGAGVEEQLVAAFRAAPRELHALAAGACDAVLRRERLGDGAPPSLAAPDGAGPVGSPTGPPSAASPAPMSPAAVAEFHRLQGALPTIVVDQGDDVAQPTRALGEGLGALGWTIRVRLGDGEGAPPPLHVFVPERYPAEPAAATVGRGAGDPDASGALANAFAVAAWREEPKPSVEALVTRWHDVVRGAGLVF